MCGDLFDVPFPSGPAVVYAFMAERARGPRGLLPMGEVKGPFRIVRFQALNGERMGAGEVLGSCDSLDEVEQFRPLIPVGAWRLRIATEDDPTIMEVWTR